MYRIARAAGQVRERRRLATHLARGRPELVARGPSEVWSWDITALKGPSKGIWYKCYVILDICSRYVTGWLVAAAEDAVVAKDFLDDAMNRNGSRPHTIHADRGGAMVSKPVSELLVDLRVIRSHSRPRTSNDNPYSEAQFKTLKYMPDFPERFGSLEDARAFCDGFFMAYNHEHRHSGIGMHTPASVHFGTAEQIRTQRQATLNQAYAQHPERFTPRPRPPRLPEAAWINQPADQPRPAL
ncbi:DDE-type integrase/transposase/recombinase [Amycolatopsis sp. SID8362]|uniref:DDE-type integrase/transposase/recombinase n=1 Tax=Amycolatopsis sp. SID8362 TaxID=2690346 RepID=UPI001370E2A5|nr:DDE-type integrase/transposase/recombinase [Amycolatopsis sp. SID8362]NBH07717.1 DDE-type integrase/transposase/recombinase [Amycolatopsis sp. SID8362]NED44413.1 transposase family protein [Amycolatopsis sp. SID8362]